MRPFAALLEPGCVGHLNPVLSAQLGLKNVTLALMFAGNDAVMERSIREAGAFGVGRALQADEEQRFWNSLYAVTPRFLEKFAPRAPWCGFRLRWRNAARRLPARKVPATRMPLLAWCAHGLRVRMPQRRWMAAAVKRGWKGVIEFSTESVKPGLDAVAGAGRRFCDYEADETDVRSGQPSEPWTALRPSLRPWLAQKLRPKCARRRWKIWTSCVHCGLCLNACPTYRELGVEMDSPRGRIYQMVQVAQGQPIGDSYREHIDLCLACRGCESACPSGVQYGRLVEAARADIEANTRRPWLTRKLRDLVFRKVLPSPVWLTAMGAMLYVYQVSGMQRLLRASGLFRLLGSLGAKEALTPPAEIPFFFRQIGLTFPAEGKRKYRVAMMAGCIANISFARLNEATVRVLQRNGCDVVIPAAQTCCGALHVHAGIRDQARALAKQNIDAVLTGKTGTSTRSSQTRRAAVRL